MGGGRRGLGSSLLRRRGSVGFPRSWISAVSFLSKLLGLELAVSEEHTIGAYSSILPKNSRRLASFFVGIRGSGAWPTGSSSGARVEEESFVSLAPSRFRALELGLEGAVMSMSASIEASMSESGCVGFEGSCEGCCCWELGSDMVVIGEVC